MKEIRFTSRFKKHYKNYQHNLKVSEKLSDFINQNLIGNIDKKWKDHQLSGAFLNYREIHLFPDVLVIYQDLGNILVLVDIGSHSDLFG